MGRRSVFRTPLDESSSSTRLWEGDETLEGGGEGNDDIDGCVIVGRQGGGVRKEAGRGRRVVDPTTVASRPDAVVVVVAILPPDKDATTYGVVLSLQQ